MDPHYGLPILLTVVVITKFSDTWAYLCGVLVGRRFISRPFSPTVSPKKSWEGFIGSLILTTLCGAFLIRFVEPVCPMWFAIISAVVFYFISVAGDLAGSLVKRGMGVKDSSHLLPGIGGIIDLIDSPARVNAFERRSSTEKMLLLTDIPVYTYQNHHNNRSS